MYTVSDKFKEVVKSNAVIATARLTLAVSNIVIDGNDLSSVTIKDYCNNNGNIIGTTMCKEAEIEIINRGYDLADKEFLLEVGVEADNGEIEYISYGNFTVKEYTDMKSNNKYKIIAYDYMDKLNKEFVDNNTYPMTLQAFYEALAKQYGVQIETQILPNQEFMIGEKPYFEGATGRTVLSAIAQMFGSFAKFNRNNKLQMYLKNETDETIDRDQMNSKLEIDNRYGPLNTVVLRLGQVEGENVTLKSEELINSANGKNLFNIETATAGYLANETGSITPPEGYIQEKTSDFIPITYGESITCSIYVTVPQTSYIWWGYLFYDKDKKPVGNRESIHYSTDTLTITGNVPQNAKYIRVSTRFFEDGVLQIEKGKVKTSYEPFKQTGEVTLEIVDNPFVYTEELRSKAIQGIYDRVLGFTYIPTSFNYKAYLYLDCGDVVQVQNMDNDGYVDTIILNQEIKVPATRKSKCENLALTKTQVQNQYISLEKQTQKRTEVLVNKQQGTIEALSEAVGNVTQNTVKGVEVQYALGDSDTIAPTSGWNVVAPKWESGKYMWQKTVTIYNTGLTVESQPTNISGAKGQDGKDGTNGKDGVDGKDGADGAQGPQGAQGPEGPQGQPGNDGSDGIGIVEIRTQYYLSSSDTEQIEGEWTETQPETDMSAESAMYLWTRSEIDWTDGTTTHTEPVLARYLNTVSETVAKLKVEQSKISSTVTTTTNLLASDYYKKDQIDDLNTTINNDIEKLKTQTSTLEQTSDAFKFKLETIENEGVGNVKNTLVTINSSGINVGQSNSSFASQINNEGMYLSSYDKVIAEYNRTGARVPKLDAEEELRAGYIRVIKATVNNEKRTHIHWIG